jgi:DNA replication licensing factor MCM4
MPASSAPMFSAAAEPDEEPDEIRAVWGTNINLSDTMRLFREFIRGFKPKYRAALDKERGVRSNAPTSHEQGEVLLYETYLRRMRQTGVTDLNLDVVNLEAYPPTKRLYSHIVKYPAEIIPAFDQVLKDMMLEIAEDDIQNGMEDMQGEEGEAEVADIISKVYKIRPYGVPTVNMRELNPTGTSQLLIFLQS